MLCFIFAALIVALDQFFKHWVLRTLEIGEVGPEVIPGVLGLTLWENDGAMLNILSGQQWLLAGIALAAAIVLIMILLRYNEGFWGTLGLAAVLGGTVGNLTDRIFNDGKVIDMFRTLFVNFPIFNIADIFITLGFLTFLIHFIALSFHGERKERTADDYNNDRYDNDYDEADAYDEFPEIDSVVAAQAEQSVAESDMSSQQYAPPAQREPSPRQNMQEPAYTADDYSEYDSVAQAPNDYDPVADITSDSSYTLDDIEADLGSLDDYNVDDLLREYGFDEDDDKL